LISSVSWLTHPTHQLPCMCATNPEMPFGSILCVSAVSDSALESSEFEYIVVLAMELLIVMTQ